MGQGGISKGLIIASKTQGWDPTRIYDPATGKYGESIENFDKAPELFKNQAGTGRLPGGTPDGWPDDTGNPPNLDTDRTTFAVPDAGRETVNRATKNASPWVGGVIGSGGGTSRRQRNVRDTGTEDVSGNQPGMDASDPAGSSPVVP